MSFMLASLEYTMLYNPDIRYASVSFQPMAMRSAKHFSWGLTLYFLHSFFSKRVKSISAKVSFFIIIMFNI